MYQACGWHFLGDSFRKGKYHTDYVSADGRRVMSSYAKNHKGISRAQLIAYDGDGNRLQKSSGKIYWYGAGTEVLDESDGSGNITDEYVYFGGKRVAHRVVSGNSIYYYGEDILGTSRQIFTSASALCYDADLYPFGGERPYTDTCPPTYKFEGKERDTETNNDDFGARYYSSSFGRWTSPDWSAVPAPVPYANLTNPQTLNLYAMVSDNPETFADLDGHFLQAFADAMEQDFMKRRDEDQENAAKQKQAQQPLSSVSVLGRTVGINYGKGLSLADELAASGKIGAAAGLINANADSLTASEKKAIGQISSFTVAGPGTYLGATGKGSMTLSAGYIGASSAAWVGSLFGHEGQHYLNAGKYSGDNLWRDEQSAGRTQLGIGNKIGFGSSESRYLEQWIDDRNRNAMQQHMQQGYSY